MTQENKNTVEVPDDVASAVTTKFVAINDITTENGYRVVRYDKFVLGLMKPDTRQLMCLHAGLGIASEGGEIADCIKKEWIYGQVHNREALIKELGDLVFYMTAIQILYDINDDVIRQENANKLSARYAQLNFTVEESQTRNDERKEAENE